MFTFLKIVAWSLLGASISWFLVLACCIAYNWAVPNIDTNERREWNQFALLMFSPWLGIIFGTGYGILRVRRNAGSSTTSEVLEC